MDMKFKIATLHVIRRAQKPIRYHAGALFQINFNTFITVRTNFGLNLSASHSMLGKYDFSQFEYILLLFS